MTEFTKRFNESKSLKIVVYFILFALSFLVYKDIKKLNEKTKNNESIKIYLKYIK